MRKILCLLLVLLFLSPFCIYFETFTQETEVSENVTEDALHNTNEVRTVIIDPGHGGSDGGASGSDGVLEKDLNLDLSLKLRDIFLLAGYDVIMTRDTDDDTDGKEGFHKSEDIFAREELSEKYPDAVFLCVHMNASPASRDKGFQVFYGIVNEKSKALAQKVHDLMTGSGLATRMREVKTAPKTVYLMNHVKNPCILLECGFISNEEDRALLKDAEYREKLALVFFTATENFLSDHP